MLPESRQYKFLHRQSGISLQFLEGQKLVHDLALVHHLQPHAFSALRDTVLATTPMTAFLKDHESFGLYIDSENPYFRFKIEAGSNGQIRALLLPEEFNNDLHNVSGISRLVKINSYTPDRAYNSINQLHHAPFDRIMDQILSESWQMPALTRVSSVSDQSLLLHKIPDRAEPGDSTVIKEFWLAHADKFNQITALALHEDEPISEAFSKLGFELLGIVPVYFKCTCSHERMLSTLRSLHRTGEDLLPEDPEEQIETRCDYCRRQYRFDRDEITAETVR